MSMKADRRYLLGIKNKPVGCRAENYPIYLSTDLEICKQCVRNLNKKSLQN
jgi:hypothetical protein